MKVTKEQIRQARQTNLYNYLIAHHANAVKIEGNTLRLANNHSVCIKQGYNGFSDFATGDRGNCIDFLMVYLGYSFQDAVMSLYGANTSNFSFSIPVKENHTEMEKEKNQNIQLPSPAKDYRRMLAYLTKTRHIPSYIIQPLIDKGLIYQADKSNNAVFVSAKKDFGELRGTLTDRPYHGIVAGSRHDGCWAFSLGKGADTAYICESAIDAISLATILGEVAYYISIAGAGKQLAVDRIKASGLKIIIATDNDQAGDACRYRNNDCDTIRPQKKDWNEDLQGRITND